MHRFGIGKHHDHFLRALRESALDGLGHMDLLRPLHGADGVTVERINHRIAARIVGGVTGWQENQRFAVDGVAFQIALQGSAVNLDVLHRDRLGARRHRRHLRLHLRGRAQRHPERNR